MEIQQTTLLLLTNDFVFKIIAAMVRFNRSNPVINKWANKDYTVVYSNRIAHSCTVLL